MDERTALTQLIYAAQAALDQSDEHCAKHYGGIRQPNAQARYDALAKAVRDARAATSQNTTKPEDHADGE